MTKRCVVCGEKARAGESDFCERHGKDWDAASNTTTWLARQVRANERRKMRELLRAAENALAVVHCGPLFNYTPAELRLTEAVRNAKSRRSR